MELRVIETPIVGMSSGRPGERREAVLNSLFMATTTVGYRGRTKQAVPHELVLQRCREAGVRLSPVP